MTQEDVLKIFTCSQSRIGNGGRSSWLSVPIHEPGIVFTRSVSSLSLSGKITGDVRRSFAV